MKINQWNEYADLYNQGITTSGDKLHKKLIDPVILDWLGNYKNLTVLDAGCGNGYLLNKLAKKAKEVIGIDGSDKLLKYAKTNKKNNNIRLILGNLLKELPLNSNSVDIAISSMVLQYLPSLEKFAKEASRVIKAGGQLIVIIDHPGHNLFLRAQELSGEKNDKFLTSGSYFKSEKRTKKSLWNKATLEYYHRPISEYINIFSADFKLDKVTEKTEDGEMPRILGLKWTKFPL